MRFKFGYNALMVMTETYSTPQASLQKTITGYFLEEKNKAILIRLPNSVSFWVPKRYLSNYVIKSPKTTQEFVIDAYILDKIGFRV